VKGKGKGEDAGEQDAAVPSYSWHMRALPVPAGDLGIGSVSLFVARVIGLLADACDASIGAGESSSTLVARMPGKIPIFPSLSAGEDNGEGEGDTEGDGVVEGGADTDTGALYMQGLVAFQRSLSSTPGDSTEGARDILLGLGGALQKAVQAPARAGGRVTAQVAIGPAVLALLSMAAEAELVLVRAPGLLARMSSSSRASRPGTAASGVAAPVSSLDFAEAGLGSPREVEEAADAPSVLTAIL